MKKAIVIGILIASSLSANALARSPFPDDRTLQPLPVSAGHPNISGNVNFRENPKDYPVQETTDRLPNTINQPTNIQTETNESSQFSAVFWVVLATLLMITAVVISRKKKESTNS